MFCRLVVVVKLSVPVQVIDWKDSSLKWPIMCWSSSSLRSAPIIEHSRVHKLTPLWTIRTRIHAVLKPLLWGRRSSSIVRSHVRLGQPARRRQPAGGRLMAARKLCEWSCDGSALARCPNRRSRLFAITEVTGVDLFYASLLHRWYVPYMEYVLY